MEVSDEAAIALLCFLNGTPYIQRRKMDGRYLARAGVLHQHEGVFDTPWQALWFLQQHKPDLTKESVRIIGFARSGFSS